MNNKTSDLAKVENKINDLKQEIEFIKQCLDINNQYNVEIANKLTTLVNNDSIDSITKHNVLQVLDINAEKLTDTTDNKWLQTIVHNDIILKHLQYVSHIVDNIQISGNDVKYNDKDDEQFNAVALETKNDDAVLKQIDISNIFE